MIGRPRTTALPPRMTCTNNIIPTRFAVIRVCRGLLQGCAELAQLGFQIFLFTEARPSQKFARSCEISPVGLPSDMVRDGRCLGSTFLPISGMRTRYLQGLVLSL